MTYDIDYYLTKLNAIPEDLWITGRLTDPNNEEKHCALGFVGFSTVPERIEEANGLIDLFMRYLGFPVTVVNDGNWMCTREDLKANTPKQRVMKALHKIKSIQATEDKTEVEIKKGEKVHELFN